MYGTLCSVFKMSLLDKVAFFNKRRCSVSSTASTYLQQGVRRHEWINHRGAGERTYFVAFTLDLGPQLRQDPYFCWIRLDARLPDGKTKELLRLVDTVVGGGGSPSCQIIGYDIRTSVLQRNTCKTGTLSRYRLERLCIPRRRASDAAWRSPQR